MPNPCRSSLSGAACTPLEMFPPLLLKKMKIHPCELSIAKDAAQPDRDEGLLMASLAAIL
jgi:hypothetical protein